VRTPDLAAPALRNLLNELLDGPAADVAYVLNPGDRGLLKSLVVLSAEQASRVSESGGSSIAAHVEHVRYGLEVLNRWAGGDQNAFANANYAVSWRRTHVSDDEWRARIDQLRREAHKWREHVLRPRDLDETEVTGMIGSVVHLAYHMGAIRQMDRALRGPAARD
jgi:hypothetical protein